jgi:L-amino acid N-acyltransferase YncA
VVSVRPATLQDWNDLAYFIEAYNREKCAKFDEPDCTRMHLDACHLAISGGYGGVFLAQDGDKLIGYCAWLSLPTMPVGMVDGIGTYVIPERRRELVAEKLNLAAIEYHKERGATRVYGVVSDDNEASRSRMEAYGARKVGTLYRWDLDREPTRCRSLERK